MISYPPEKPAPRSYLDGAGCVLDVGIFRRRGWLEPGASFLWHNALLARSPHRNSDDRVLWAVREALDGRACTGTCDGETLRIGIPGEQPIYIRLSVSGCNYGGARKWVICPRCDGRYAKLYLRAAALICRHCADLHYRSQSESAPDRALRRAKKAWVRASPVYDPARNITPGHFPWEKPKGMHWKTFSRLAVQYRSGLNIWGLQAFREIGAKLERKRPHERQMTL